MIMKKRKCPQCDIYSFYILNNKGESLLVYVDENYNIIARNPKESLYGYNLDTIYCLGCSWKGSPKSLR